jgi:Common central domain of tyrosinase
MRTYVLSRKPFLFLSLALGSIFLFGIHSIPARADQIVCTSDGNGTDHCDILLPNVLAATTPYPTISFNNGDTVNVSASGCVQTGGTGKTWKRIVDPKGPNSGHLYRGTILIPGATAAPITLQAAMAKGTMKATAGPLILGYQDDGYGDNGYWKHDSGTDDQCADQSGPNGGRAMVHLDIHRAATAHAPAGAIYGQCVATDSTHRTCRIDRPDVTVAHESYPSVVFQPGEYVTISADGCVQTGGVDKTWKDYVYPKGPNSDHLYYGLISIAGVTPGMVPLSSVVGFEGLPLASGGTLELGYEDDQYGDNGYWSHDDGTGDQCKNKGPASVTITISAHAPSRIRISAKEFATHPDMVASYERGVSAMKALPASDRSSWQYWAAMHEFVGSSPAFSDAAVLKTENSGGCEGNPECLADYDHLVNLSPPDAVAKAVWQQCQHGTPFFLAWHRLYLIYFERVVRKMSGDPSFMLPYWDYLSESGPSGTGALPAIVRNSNSPLYDLYRTTGFNDNTAGVDPDAADISVAFSSNVFSNFQTQLEETPHGTIHCQMGFRTCASPDMSLVPVAGQDPLFYMHHANIDRLWQCWMNKQIQAKNLPSSLDSQKQVLAESSSWLSKQFNFVDETGAEIMPSVGQLFETGFVDYRYDKETNCDGSQPAPERFVVSRPTFFLHSQALQLSGKAAQIELAPPARAVAEPSPLPSAIEPEPGHTFLVLENVAFKEPLLSTYKIYIAKKSAPAKRIYVSMISLFGARGHAMPATHQMPSLLYYDVTRKLAELGAIRDGDSIVTSFDVVKGPAPGPNLRAVIEGSVSMDRVYIQTAR